MNQSQITTRYAKALFDLALEQRVLDRVKDDMILIDEVCHQNKDLRGMLHNPVIQVEKKQKVLHQVFGSTIDKLTLGFLDIIARKRREYYIDGIASAFVALFKEYKGIKTAYVTSAVALTDTDRKAILDMFRNFTGKEIELIEQLNPGMLGGFVLSLDNYQIDQSLRTKVKQLKKDFEKNLYIKGF